MPSLMERAELLASSLGIRPVLEKDGILGVVRAASAMLGWRPKDDMVLGDMLDALAEEVGSAPAPAPAPAATASTSASSSTTPSSSTTTTAPNKARKRPLPKGQQSLFSAMPDGKKLKTSFAEIKKQRELAAQDMDYEPVVDDMKTFRSEYDASSSAAPSVATFRCKFCPRTFPSAGARFFHEATHRDSTQPMDLGEPVPPAPAPVVSLRIVLSDSGDVEVCELSLDGRPVTELAAEAARPQRSVRRSWSRSGRLRLNGGGGGGRRPRQPSRASTEVARASAISTPPRSELKWSKSSTESIRTPRSRARDRLGRTR